MSSRRSPSARGGSARGTLVARGTVPPRRRRAKSINYDSQSEDSDSKSYEIRPKVRKLLEALCTYRLTNGVRALAAIELNPVEASTSLYRMLEIVLAAGDQLEYDKVELKNEIDALNERITELERETDNHTVILEDDRENVFAPSLRNREVVPRGSTLAPALGSIRGSTRFTPMVRGTPLPTLRPREPLAPPIAVQQPELPYPVSARLADRAPSKQYTVVILHYLATAVPIDAVVKMCVGEQRQLNEWSVGLDEGRGEVIAALHYGTRKVVTGAYTFRINTDLPTLTAIPPPKQHMKAFEYVNGLANHQSWKAAEDLSEFEAQ